MRPGLKSLMVLAACAMWLGSIGQQFAAEAGIPAVSSPGFYRIAIRPDLSVFSKPDFSDLRLVNEKGQFIPYLPFIQQPLAGTSKLLEFQILSSKSDTGSTVLEIESGDHAVSELSFVIANTAASRYVSVSGSNDRGRWYVISEDLLLSGGESAKDGTFYQSVFFPYSRYRYYRLTIQNAGGDPMNILKTGIFQQREVSDSSGWIRNEAMSLISKDSNQRTWITLSATRPYLIEQLELEISSPKFYNRTLTVYLLNADGTRRQIETGNLNSENQAVLSLQPIKPANLLLEIENGDNQPVKVQKLYSLQRKRYITAYLEPETKYRLMAGDPNLPPPNFDIASFSNKIPSEIPELVYGEIKTVQEKTEDVGNDQLMIWIAIGAGILLLGGLSYKLVHDMKKNQVAP